MAVVTAAQAPVSPGRGHPGTDRTSVPGMPPEQQSPEAARLTAELGVEVTPDTELPGRYEAMWDSGILRGTAAELRAFFQAGTVRA